MNLHNLFVRQSANILFYECHRPRTSSNSMKLFLHSIRNQENINRGRRLSSLFFAPCKVLVVEYYYSVK